MSALWIVTYLFIMKMLVDTHERPMWLPRQIHGTVEEGSSKKANKDRSVEGIQLAGRFLGHAVVVGLAADWLIANAGITIDERAGLFAGIIDGIFIAVATSLAELVIAMTAVRAGALSLAVGDIVGGNAFDTLHIAGSDLYLLARSIYRSISDQELVWLGAIVLMNYILRLGLIYRERRDSAECF